MSPDCLFLLFKVTVTGASFGLWRRADKAWTAHFWKWTDVSGFRGPSPLQSRLSLRHRLSTSSPKSFGFKIKSKQKRQEWIRGERERGPWGWGETKTFSIWSVKLIAERPNSLSSFATCTDMYRRHLKPTLLACNPERWGRPWPSRRRPEFISDWFHPWDFIPLMGKKKTL